MDTKYDTGIITQTQKLRGPDRGVWLSLLLVFPLVFAQPLPVEPQAIPDIDWPAVEKEAGELLSQVVRIDTSNPPGNETAAAQFWQNILTQEGIEAQVYESEPGRGIVYGRLKGSSKKKASSSCIISMSFPPTPRNGRSTRLVGLSKTATSTAGARSTVKA